MMYLRKIRLALIVLQLALLWLGLFLPGGVVQAASNTDWPFLRLWERGDYPVAIGAVQRSWYWGPSPFAFTEEGYAEAPGELRRVSYYDKSRMEISNPGGDQNSKWYVTNGLLVRELISGQLQLGDNQFQALRPAEIPVSGDGPDENPFSPTYASFSNLTAPLAANQSSVTALLQRNGKVTEDATLATRYPETASAYYDTNLGHNIPGVMWKSLNLQGLVVKDRKLVNDKIEDWLFSFGLPITDAYWTRSKVAGVEKDILVQLFERRVLTYTPSNEAAYQVEMGNVGRHYYNWRYANPLQRPAPATTYSEPAIRLSIPAINVDTLIEYVGVKSDNSMDVPLNPQNVGWYRLGARVGEKGNAVLAGHLDWNGIGPVVFWNLNKLKPGDLVYVSTSLGTRHTFRVTESGAYPLNNYPQVRIFGDSEQANLNLITCNGSFDPRSASYDKRLVVYTTLVE